MKLSPYYEAQLRDLRAGLLSAADVALPDLRVIGVHMGFAEHCPRTLDYLLDGETLARHNRPWTTGQVATLRARVQEAVDAHRRGSQS